VDITIGIQNVARELSIEVNEEAATVTKRVNDAITSGEALTVTDSRGQTIVVPPGAIGYVIVGAGESRRVGFGI